MVKKPRLALLVPWIKSKGGAERVVLTLLKDKKYDIDVYTFSYQKEKTFKELQNFKIFEVGKRGDGAFITKGLRLFRNLLATEIKDLDKYDAFIISTAGITEFAVFRNHHKKTIALTHTPLRAAHSMYDYYKNESYTYRLILPVMVHVYRFLEKRAWRKIRYAMVLSDEVRNRLLDYHLIKATDIIKLGPCADYSKVHRSVTHKKIIFYPSRFINYKRQDLAVASFRASELPKRGFKLVLGGFVEDKKYFRELEAAVGSDKNIILKTNLSEEELKELYRDCYATIFLAINEDTGLVPLESLSYGKPVISVDEGGPKEFIKNGVNGLLVNADPKEIGKALDSIVDKKLYLKLKKGAIASPRYDSESFLKNFDRGIKTILDTR